jgi:hypothetical protein
MSGSLTRIKEEPDASAPPSSKKAWCLTKDTVLQLEYQALDDPKEFLGLKAAKFASFNEVQLGTLDFVLAWSRQDVKKPTRSGRVASASVSTWRTRTTTARASGVAAMTARDAAPGRQRIDVCECFYSCR